MSSDDTPAQTNLLHSPTGLRAPASCSQFRPSLPTSRPAGRQPRQQSSRTTPWHRAEHEVRATATTTFAASSHACSAPCVAGLPESLTEVGAALSRRCSPEACIQALVHAVRRRHHVPGGAGPPCMRRGRIWLVIFTNKVPESYETIELRVAAPPMHGLPIRGALVLLPRESVAGR